MKTFKQARYEFKKARDEWIELNYRDQSQDYQAGCYFGADWSRDWMLKHDPIVRDMYYVLALAKEQLEYTQSLFNAEGLDNSVVISSVDRTLSNYRKEVGEL